MLFERRCPGCGQRSAGLCRPCRRSVVPPDPPVVPGLDRVAAWCRYEGAGRAAVLALKHGGRRDLARDLGRELARLAGPVDVVTWVPASGAGRRRRGYDQGELLARAAAGALGRRPARLLCRAGGAASQRGRDRRQRLAGAAFRARRPVAGTVLLVDDVTTTGASLARAAAALRDAGAASVVAVVVAVADRPLAPPAHVTCGTADGERVPAAAARPGGGGGPSPIPPVDSDAE